jgi:hypothetical protein
MAYAAGVLKWSTKPPDRLPPADQAQEDAINAA